MTDIAERAGGPAGDATAGEAPYADGDGRTGPEPLPRAYDPGTLEPRLAARWEARRVGHAEPGGNGGAGGADTVEPFSIVLPPPNVTGSLHIGHALDVTLPDVLVRRARMQGRDTVWLPGTDHAGIATHSVVERRLLAEEDRTRFDVGRDAFVERIWDFVRDSGGRILYQLRRLGCSCDWDREVFTLDEARSAAVRKVFCDWYEQGLIYRGKRMINWDPAARTALSDIEVDHEEVDGELTYLRYPVAGDATGDAIGDADGDGAGEGVVVATTRAETMLGDVAVAVHPHDERYVHLVGRTLRLPLVDREIPVVADDVVDPEFGTGAVKITPAHDFNDFALAARHGLAGVEVLDETGRVTAAGGRFTGMDRFEAREAVKEALAERGLLVRTEPYRHSVGHSSRTGAVMEPRVSEQWFVGVRPLADAAAAAVRDGRTRFVPERNARGFLDWLDNLQDWCISRQIWWGHRIPAWYAADGGVHVLREDPSPEEVERLGLVRDDDVLDTWFSSQLWPLTTMGWPRDTPELARWYPTTVLVTGYDINTFWVSRMLMSGLRITGEVPFRTVLNHGLVRDAHGKKMSKSFGNSIDPLDLVDRYGADALRYALLSTASPGTDVPLAEEWVEGGRRFANKLWNAARFVLMSRPGHARLAAGGLEGLDGPPDGPPDGPTRVPTGVPTGAAMRARTCGSRTCGSRTCASRTGGSCRGWRPPARTRTRRWRHTTSAAPPSGCTTSSGTSTATGTWSSRSSATTRSPAASSSASSTPRCACCTQWSRS